jgi:hypothetical protein
MGMRIHNVIYNKNWVDMKPGWYELRVHFPIEKEDEVCSEFIIWLYEAIDNCERHALWEIEEGMIKSKFRHERDYLLAALRWGG